MNRWNSQRDVAHVGRTCGPVMDRPQVGELSAERFGVAAINISDLTVMFHLGVGLCSAGDIQGRAGSERACLETPVHSGPQLAQLLESFAAYDVPGSGACRNNVGRIAAMGGDSMNAIGGSYMLSQQADRGLGDRQCIGCIDSKLGESRRMGFLADVFDFKHRCRDDFRHDDVPRCRVNHHSHVGAVKCASLEEQNLAAGVADLFGRRTDDLDSQPASSATLAAAIPAAMMLWPQACPMPGKESYSAQIATCRGPFPDVAVKAVGRPQLPRSTANPP